MILSRRPLTSVFALIVYFTINVAAAALHHHDLENAELDTQLSLAISAGPLTSDGDNDSDDDDDSCLLCSVLHLIQAPPSCVQVENLNDVVHFAAAPAALLRPYPLPAVTHSRAPPLI